MADLRRLAEHRRIDRSAQEGQPCPRHRHRRATRSSTALGVEMTPHFMAALDLLDVLYLLDTLRVPRLVDELESEENTACTLGEKTLRHLLDRFPRAKSCPSKSRGSEKD